MDNNSILTNEGALQLSQAIEVMKASIKEITDISENLIPEKLIKLGLKEYLTELCKEIETEYKVTLNITFKGDDFNLDDSAKIKTYRIFTALLNYILIHARPSEINLFLSYTNNVLDLQETDNGNDFNLAVLTYPGVTKVKSIKTLTDSMNGDFTISRNNNKNEAIILLPI